jgi:hypothetical protein
MHCTTSASERYQTYHKGTKVVSLDFSKDNYFDVVGLSGVD